MKIFIELTNLPHTKQGRAMKQLMIETKNKPPWRKTRGRGLLRKQLVGVLLPCLSPPSPVRFVRPGSFPLTVVRPASFVVIVILSSLSSSWWPSVIQPIPFPVVHHSPREQLPTAVVRGATVVVVVAVIVPWTFRCSPFPPRSCSWRWFRVLQSS